MTSIIKVDQIQNAAGGIPTAADLGLNVSGSVLQVKQGASSSSIVFNLTLGTGTTIFTGPTITPSSTSSKIFISFSVQQGSSDGGYANLRLERNGTAVAIGDADGSRIQATTNFRNDLLASQLSWNNEFLDSPSSTSALTYKLQVYNNTIGTWYVNRSSADTNSASQGRTVSTITAYEIAG